MPKAEYKSAVRSRARIRDAFVELLQEKPPEKITVTDIVKRAEINRGTFYAHYADIYALLDSVSEEILTLLYQALADLDYTDLSQSPLSALLTISDFLQQNADIFRAMFKNASAMPFFEKLQSAFIEFMENNPKIDAELRASEPFRSRARFFAGGVTNLYRAWFCGELDGTLTDLAYTISEIICQNSLLFQAK
ncbi:MAG: TetR/AcrR family transcriptional regulator [Candidatus Fimenecus sp.]